MLKLLELVVRMKISVIVITKNNADCIEKCILSLVNQSYSKDLTEFLFVDGHSNDGTDNIVKEYSKRYSSIKLLYENVGSMGGARNVGIENSNGDIIAFIDADAYVNEDWLTRIEKHFKNDPRTIVLGGFDVLVGGEVSRSNMDSWRRKEISYGVNAISKIKTVNFAIKREALSKVGGFDSGLSHFDEAELMARVYSKFEDAQIVYDPNLFVYHQRHPVSLQRKFKKLFTKSSIGVPVLLRKHLFKVALLSIFSPIGTSLLFIFACLVSPFVLFFLFTNLDYFLYFVLLFCVSGFGVVAVYFVAVKWKTGKVDFRLPLLLFFDVPIRFMGTFVGLLKWASNGLTGLVKTVIKK